MGALDATSTLQGIAISSGRDSTCSFGDYAVRQGNAKIAAERLRTARDKQFDDPGLEALKPLVQKLYFGSILMKTGTQD